MKADLIIHNAGELVTCASGGRPKRRAELRDAGIVRGGAVAVAAGQILKTGPSEEIRREFDGGVELDAGGRVVAPGFVDCHTHIIFAGNRFDEFERKIAGADYLEILAAGGGILSTVRQTRAATVAELVAQTLRRLDKMLACGTTTAEIKTGYGLDAETEFKMMDVWNELDGRHAVETVPTFLAAHAVPPEFKGRGGEFAELVCREMIPRLAEWRRYSYLDEDRLDFAEKLAKPFFVDVFCERNAFDLAQTRRILETAREFGFRLKAHVDEFTNLGGSRLAVGLGATSIDHLDAISDEEIALLAASETIGVVTPTVNFNLGAKEFADARRLVDSGAALALSTDYNPGSAPCPSLPNAMAIACRYQKLLPAEAFNAATVNAAFAVALGGAAGSLEAGKRADLVVYDAKDYREIAYEFGGNPVAKVVKSGRIVYEN